MHPTTAQTRQQTTARVSSSRPRARSTAQGPTCTSALLPCAVCLCGTPCAKSNDVCRYVSTLLDRVVKGDSTAGLERSLGTEGDIISQVTAALSLRLNV